MSVDETIYVDAEGNEWTWDELSPDEQRGVLQEQAEEQARSSQQFEDVFVRDVVELERQLGRKLTIRESNALVLAATESGNPDAYGTYIELFSPRDDDGRATRLDPVNLTNDEDRQRSMVETMTEEQEFAKAHEAGENPDWNRISEKVQEAVGDE